MARGTIPQTQINRSGATPPAETNGDAVNNHQMSNDGRVLLFVRNSNGGSTARTVTFRPTKTVDGGTVTKPVSIAAGATKVFGPFPVDLYGSLMQIDVDNAELKFQAYHL